jgi:ketosteroid isomerase-like protein
MPSENVEVVRSWYGPGAGAQSQDALDWLVEHAWNRDVEWRAIEGAADDVGVMRGSGRLRRYYEEWLELFDPLTIEPLELVEAAGDRVVGAFRVSGKARGSGVETELRYAAWYELRDGRLVRGREYNTKEEAIAAAQEAARSDAPEPSGA